MTRNGILVDYQYCTGCYSSKSRAKPNMSCRSSSGA